MVIHLKMIGMLFNVVHDQVQKTKKEKTYLSLEMCGSFSNLYKPGVNFNSFFCFAD